MKRFPVILVLSVLFTCSVQSLSAQKRPINYKDYFINLQYDDEGYQQYKGATIVFYEPPKTDKPQFNLGGIAFGEQYVIDNICIYYALALRHVDIRVFKKDDRGGKMIHVKCLNGESTDRKPGIVDLPAYIYEPMENLEAEYLHKEVFANGKQYTITGFDFADHVVSFIFSSADGDKFKEPVNEALAYTCVESLSVEKPENEAIQHGETTMIMEDKLTKYCYIDNVLGIVIFHNERQFFFALHNLSDSTLKIVWDEAALVDANGSTSKVIHSGVKYNERENSQVPSVVVKGAKLEDTIIPADRIRYNDEPGIHSWIISPMYESGQVGNVALLLPIQIKGVINEYIFVFERKAFCKYPELHSSLR